MVNRCYIFAAGDYCGVPEIKSNDFVITADAGYLHTQKLGIAPNLAMGDFDSLEFVPKNCEIIKFNPQKDQTDTSLSCLEALKRGYNDITICGALGGERFDHTFANIQTAFNLSKKGANITLTDGDTFIRIITDSRIDFNENHAGYVSVFSLSEISEGVDICGLKYELSGAVLSSSIPLGVSNEFIGSDKSYVSVRKGTLALMWKNYKCV